MKKPGKTKSIFTVPEPFTEEEYDAKMAEAEAWLSGCTFHEYFESYDGKKISYFRYLSEEHYASVVISIGFTEFAEKFTELAYYLVKSGFDVYTIEHRGHGYSHRDVSDLQTAHIDSFSVYADDFTFFIKNVLQGLTRARKTFLLCHSMGCAVASFALCDLSVSDLVSCAVLSSPMLSFSPRGMTDGMLLRISEKCIREEGRTARFKYSHPFNPDTPFEYSGDLSRCRFKRNMSKRIENDFYKCTMYTNAWVYESLIAVKKLQKSAENVKTPVLMLTAQHDHTIKRRTQEKFARHLPDCRYVCIKGAKHSLFTSDTLKLRRIFEYIYSFWSDFA